tara:strand:- start:605 stop:859 length:255 start_codon:yes stop_codon:yes gene_type:complete
VLTNFKKSLEQMKVSFKSDAKSVKDATNILKMELSKLKTQSLKEDLKKSEELDSTVKLIEKLSILNEYKLNLFKDFSKYNTQKK